MVCKICIAKQAVWNLAIIAVCTSGIYVATFYCYLSRHSRRELCFEESFVSSGMSSCPCRRRFEGDAELALSRFQVVRTNRLVERDWAP